MKNSIINKNDNGFYVLTGKMNNLTVVDIDDISLDHNKKLMNWLTINVLHWCNKPARIYISGFYIIKIWYYYQYKIENWYFK